MRKAGTKAANSTIHGQATSLKREVTNAGFEPMDNDEKALYSKFKNLVITSNFQSQRC